MKKYIFKYESRYFEADVLEDFAYILGLKIVHNAEQGNYQVFINYGRDSQIEIACYSDIENNGNNGYSLEEINKEVFSERFFKEKLNYSNINLYKVVY